jgi:hypothetical protein
MVLQQSLQEGSIVVIENAGEVTNTSLLSILRREMGMHRTMKFND